MDGKRDVEERTSYTTLFFTFLRIGAFTFGGGLAMLPILKREVVDNHKWASEEELIDYYSIGQMTPGIIAINVSTIIGYKKRGILGAFIAAFSFLLPAFLLITLLASLIFRYSNNEYLQYAFNGIRITVCALIGHTVIKMAKIGVVDLITGLIFIASFIMIAILEISPIPVVVFAALTGMISKGVRR
ncbi:chromate transporter [Microaceticoccus formicicus]|uniref:chromate transporter n=1 Tax=Microaceticoccus formicicus TaxID=3118105 RepID=UPI003CCFFD01|nr:chromate transporter [Peptoniphilaceae bacterium AMB_02]